MSPGHSGGLDMCPKEASWPRAAQVLGQVDVDGEDAVRSGEVTWAARAF